MRVLVVEDEPQIADLLKYGLEEMAYVVDVAENSLVAHRWTQLSLYDYIVLELKSPGIDGLQLCRCLRSEGQQSLILMLTATDAIEERLNGFAAGADDCLSKPFVFVELLARLHALSRRRVEQRHDLILQIADLRLNLLTYQVWRGQQEIELSPKELALLALFMRHPNQILTREIILQQAWHQPARRQVKVDITVRHLRHKIDAPFEVKLIQTIHGLGYLMSNPNAAHGNSLYVNFVTQSVDSRKADE